MDIVQYMNTTDYAYACKNSYKLNKEETITIKEVIETILSFIACALLVGVVGILCIAVQ